MDNYNLEKSSRSLTGKIICGSRCGYDSDKEFGLEETLALIEETNKEISDEGLTTIPCIVQEGTLIGRASTENYREQVYTLNFSHSPRLNPIKSDTFYNTLLLYADKLGNKMQQTRMYIEFNGNTTILKKST